MNVISKHNKDISNQIMQTLFFIIYMLHFEETNLDENKDPVSTYILTPLTTQYVNALIPAKNFVYH